MFFYNFLEIYCIYIVFLFLFGICRIENVFLGIGYYFIWIYIKFFVLCFDRFCFNCDLVLVGIFVFVFILVSGWWGRDIRLFLRVVIFFGVLLSLEVVVWGCVFFWEVVVFSFGLNFSVWYFCFKVDWSIRIFCFCYLRCLSNIRFRRGFLGESFYCRFFFFCIL